ncbi:MAG: tetratricopeptide repeat protein [Cytophagales bacterium]|nr:MAG: tetratricopeptide repeat protein [Cytophagales bacterium]
MLYLFEKQSLFAILAILFLNFSCQPRVENQLADAKKMFAKGDFAAAIPILEAATGTDQNNADAWNMLGIAYYETQKHEQATAHFNKAIKLNNQNYKYFYNRANAQRELNLLLEAIDDYGKALILESNVADIYFNRAVVLVALNRKKEAIPDFEACLKLAPEFAKAHFGLASAQISVKQEVSAESCEHLQKALALGYKEAQEALYLYCKK